MYTQIHKTNYDRTLTQHTHIAIEKQQPTLRANMRKK